MSFTKEQIAKAIANLPNLSDDELAHNWKSATSMKSTSDKIVLKPFISAVEAERKKRGKIIVLEDTSIHAPEKVKDEEDAYGN
jgi:hypothetical protein